MNEKGLHHPGKGFPTEEFMKGRSSKTAAKTGANRWHNLIASNATIAIGSRLSGNKYDVYVNDMQVKMRGDRACFPNLVIVSGEPKFTSGNEDVLLNPTVVLQIFSSNTADKNEKLEEFLAIDSIKECLMVKADEMRVEHYGRQNPKQWIYKIYNERDDVISLDSVQCKISLSELYSQIKFSHAAMSSTAVN